MKLFSRKIELFLLFGILLTIISPWILTKTYKFFNFQNASDLGAIIGGITAPITSIIGALLIYYALIAQRQANKIQIENNSVQSLLSLIFDLERKCEDLIFFDESLNQRKGIAAFNSIGSILYFDQIKPYMGEKTDKYKNDLMSVNNFGNYYNVIMNAVLVFDFIESEKCDDGNRNILNKRFEHIYIIFLRKSLRRIYEYYNKAKENGEIENDRYLDELVEFRNKLVNKYNAP